jgi:hypothetical protein
MNIPHPVFEDRPDRGFRNVGKHNLTPGKYPKEHLQYSKYGESLKSRIAPTCFGITLPSSGSVPSAF